MTDQELENEVYTTALNGINRIENIALTFVTEKSDIKKKELLVLLKSNMSCIHYYIDAIKSEAKRAQINRLYQSLKDSYATIKEMEAQCAPKTESKNEQGTKTNKSPFTTIVKGFYDTTKNNDATSSL